VTAPHVRIGSGDRRGAVSARVVRFVDRLGQLAGVDGQVPVRRTSSSTTGVMASARRWRASTRWPRSLPTYWALADDLGWDTFDLIGHSMGGKAAQRVLADAPQRVRRLVTISSAPTTGVEFDAQAWELFVGAAADDAKTAAIIDHSTGNRLTQTWIDQMVAHSVERCTREAFDGYLPAWAKTDFSDEVIGKSHLVKVIVGEYDPVREITDRTLMQHYPNASLEVIPNAGHYAMFEAPIALATSVGNVHHRPVNEAMSSHRIGLLVPSSNTTMETEVPEVLRRNSALTGERFTFHSNRMRMRTVEPSELAAMNADSDRAAVELADAAVDVMAYACLVRDHVAGSGRPPRD